MRRLSPLAFADFSRDGVRREAERLGARSSAPRAWAERERAGGKDEEQAALEPAGARRARRTGGGGAVRASVSATVFIVDEAVGGSGETQKAIARAIRSRRSPSLATGCGCCGPSGPMTPPVTAAPTLTCPPSTMQWPPTLHLRLLDQPTH
jgi:hypothetical protein